LLQRILLFITADVRDSDGKSIIYAYAVPALFRVLG